MSMTVVVTRNVSDRMRGFLASAMLEASPGVYCGFYLSKAVRERIWSVLDDWFPKETDASVVMLWREPSLPGGQGIRTLGTTPISFVEKDGMVLAMKPLQSSSPDDGHPSRHR
ncbi:MAG: type I-E CRISPR-associated endoribonuclease Cas2e [Bacillota bacterium]|nr:type I-E CRISPR-associated endoribonuclease Cas2e [Bacillota bacterium]